MNRRWIFTLMFCLVAVTAVAGGEQKRSGARYEKVIPVERGRSLDVRLARGYLYVDAWDRNEIRIVSSAGAEEALEMRELRNVIVLSSGEDDEWEELDLDISLPRWMELRIAGNAVEVEIEGVEGRVDVEVVEGDIKLVGGRERVRLRSINGSISVEHAQGRIDLSSTQDNVTVLDSSGQILTEAINGDIRIAGVDSDNVEAISVSGDVLYDGTLHDRGNYYLSTHAGDINVAVSSDASLSVSIATERGDFESDFDVRLMPLTKNGRLEFMLGDGSANLRIESFSGDIFFFDPKKGRKKRPH
jgi:hypothetical protein